jgi:hypothetical protein
VQSDGERLVVSATDWRVVNAERATTSWQARSTDKHARMTTDN